MDKNVKGVNAAVFKGINPGKSFNFRRYAFVPSDKSVCFVKVEIYISGVGVMALVVAVGL